MAGQGVSREAKNAAFMTIQDKLEKGKFIDLGKWRRVLDHTGGSNLINVQKDNICTVVTDKNFIHTVKLAMNHSGPPKGASKRRVWSLSEIKECALYIRDFFPVIDMPKSFAMYGDNSLCFSRLPFKPESIPTPLHDSWMKLHKDPVAFQSWGGSTFFPDSDLSQYLWLWGDGGNGKSTFANLMDYCFGNAYVPLRVPNNGGAARFFGASLIGKRFGCFTEVRNPRFGRDGILLNLTGGTPIEVELKQLPPWKIMLDSKIMLCSNFQPEISTQASENRRMVLCELSSVDIAPTKGYQEDYNAEGAGIVKKLMDAYEKNVIDKNLVKIPVSKVELAKASSEEIDLFKDILERYFETTHIRDVVDSKNYLVATAEVTRVLKEQERWCTTQIRNWKRWAIKEKNLDLKQVKLQGENRDRFIGMRAKKITLRPPWGNMGAPQLIE